MKKWTNKLSRIVLVFALLFATLAAILPASEVKAVARTLYWVGGTDTWNATAGAKWSLTSGGASGEAIPDSDDIVIFDGGSGAVVVTSGASNNCDDLLFTGTGAFGGTFTGTNSYTLSIYGSLQLVPGMTYTNDNALNFKSTAAGETITSAGQTILGNITFSGAGGEWTLQDALVTDGDIAISNGSLITSNFNITTGLISNQFNMTGGTVTLGTSVVTVGQQWNCSGGTLSAASSTIQCAPNGTYFKGNGNTYGTVDWSGFTFATPYISGANTFTNLTIANGNAAGVVFQIKADQIVTGTLTITGANSSSKRLTVKSDSTTGRELRVTGAVNITNANLGYIYAGGPLIPWDISAGLNYDLGHNLYIQFSTGSEMWWVGNTGSTSDINHWASSSNGTPASAPRLPTLLDTVYFDEYSVLLPGRTITFDYYDFGGIDASEVLNNPTFASASVLNIYGSFSAGASCTWNPAITLCNRLIPSTFSAATGLNGAVVIDTDGMMVTVASDSVIADSLTLSSGYLDLDDHNLTAETFASTVTTYDRAIHLGAGIFVLNGVAGGSKWNVAATNFAVYAEESTIVFTNSGAAGQTFAGASLIYNNFAIMGAGNYTTTITGNSTFGDIYIDRSVAAKTLAGAVTVTMTNMYLPVSGVTQITITNTDFIQTTGTVSGQYMTISGSTAAGGATFLAGLAPPSVDGGGNVGWSFTDVVAPTIATSAATDLTLTGATLNGNVTNMGSFAGSTIYAYFEYGDTPAYGNTTTEQPVTAIGIYDDPITGLSSDTLYYYRAAVRYDGTSYAYGAQITFTTLGAPIVTTIAASDITAVSAALQGLLDTGLTASVYVRFDYGYDTSFGLTTPWQTFNTDTAFNAFVYNLQPSTTYHYRAVGLYGAAVYVYGGNLTFITTDGSGTDADQSANRDRDVLPEAETSDWFLNPDIGGALLTNPFRPLVTMVSDTTTLNEIQVWRLYALAILLFFIVLTAKALPHHLLITGIVAGALIWGFVALTIFPGWALVFAIGGVLGGLVAERTGQL